LQLPSNSALGVEFDP